jgi:hypothetical protein
MKYFLLTGILFLGLNAFAESLSLLPIYDANSRNPGILIPFKISGDILNGGEIRSLEVINPSAGLCQLMQDPYLATIILLKCTKVAKVGIRVNVAKNNKFYSVSLNSIQIKLPGSGGVVIDPGDDDPNILAGRQLFVTYCIGCHQAINKTGRTATQITNAVNSINDMKPLKTILVGNDYKKLEAYLGSL